MASTTDLIRANLITQLGLTASAAAKLSISDLESLQAAGGSAGSSGGMLASATWQPGGFTQTLAASAVIADIDASLVCAFKGPSSGKVEVALSGRIDVASTNDYFWMLRDAGSVEIVNSKHIVGRTIWTGRMTSFLILTVVSGTDYSWKWSHVQPAGGTGTKVTASSDMPVTMRVRAA